MGSNPNSWPLPLQQAESAQLELLRYETLYNIHVKAMRNDDHRKQSEWESLRVNTSHFGELSIFLASSRCFVVFSLQFVTVFC